MTTKTAKNIKNLLLEASAELSHADKLMLMELKIPVSAVFHIVAQIQLALRHPNNQGPKAAAAESIARQLQSQFLENSSTYQVLEMGWNPDLDCSLSDLDDDSDPDYEPVTGDEELLVIEDITDEIPKEKYEEMVALSKAIEQSIIGTLNELDPAHRWEVVNLGELGNESQTES